MNSFAAAISNQEARTEKGMKARVTTASNTVDLFYKIGASRGQDIIPAFVAAYAENPDLALRIAAWARDVRGGVGERKLYRDILSYLEMNNPSDAVRLALRTPEVGRWDDLLVFKTTEMRDYAFSLISGALTAKNGLCAKWMPRKGEDAVALREFLKLTPKRYRKLLVGLSKTVEQQMCAKDWENINFSHVPSVASARYKKAFWKRAKDAYAKYLNTLKEEASLPVEERTVKVNAGAVYPYDVIKTVRHGDMEATQLVISQWDALPNFVGEHNTLALVDVSGSMTSPVGGSVTAMDVAISLGLYVADKNTGAFKDCFLTFTSQPQLLKLTGNIVQKVHQMETAQWHGSTNLHAAFEKILQTAIAGQVSPSEMPATLLILSDMQFDSCIQHDDSAIQMIERKYANAGYDMPNVVFWNINDYGNTPVELNKKGVALVSGFSPAIMKSILAGTEFTPEAIMMSTIMNSRYDI